MFETFLFSVMIRFVNLCGVLKPAIISKLLTVDQWEANKSLTERSNHTLTQNEKFIRESVFYKCILVH